MNLSEKKVLVCVNEFWGAWNTFWGGYGFLARIILPEALGIKKENFHVCLGRNKEHSLRKFYAIQQNTTEEGYKLIKLPRIKRLAAKIVNSYDLVISIEATVPYLFYLEKYLKKKILFWVQDPRELSDWKKFASIKYAKDVNYYSQKDYDQVSTSYRDNKIKFVTQGNCLSDKAKRLYSLPDDARIDLLPNPIKVDYNLYDIDKKDNSVIFLGRFDTQKRGWIFCEIAKKMPSIQFYMMGQSSDSFEASQNHFVKDYATLKNLHFMGRCVGERKAAIMRQAKILINCSIHEGIPISFLEAFGYGVCVVSNLDPDSMVSRFGFKINESTGDGFNSVPSFVDAINVLLNDSSLWKLKVKQAYEYVNTVHSYDSFRKNIAQITKSL